MEETEFIDIKELARRLKLSTKTIYRWVENESVPYAKFGRVIRFEWNTILKWEKKTNRGNGNRANKQNGSPFELASVAKKQDDSTQECFLEISKK